MNKQDGVGFLLTILQEIKHSFTNPVIFFTQQDYSRNIFNTLKNIHNALLNQEPPEKVADIVRSFHIGWKEAVQEIEMFSRRIKDTPRAVIDAALKYTMECTELRYNYTVEYITEMKFIMNEEENQIVQIDLRILKDLKYTVNSALGEKEQYIHSQADQTEFLAKIAEEVEELFHWLDRLNNNLATELCKVLHFEIPITPSNLRNTLKEIVQDIAIDSAPEVKKVTQLIHNKSRVMTSAERMEEVNEIQIAKVTEKIRVLEARMSRLRVDDSSGLMALKHKTIFLEDRLQSLENIRTSVRKLIKNFREQVSDENSCEYRPMNIFSHLLPHQDRCRLVDKLTQLWTNALTKTKHEHESVTDILSVVDLKEVYSDEIGNFTVDTYGRKIYSIGKDETSYQLNEHNNLVPLSDDEQHIYFYDVYGRYYIGAEAERIYKNHDGASEYKLNKAGRLIKISEVKDGVEYYYDNLGRYFVNSQGRHIYRDEDSDGEIEHDGFGNFVKNQKRLNYVPYPMETISMEENKHLTRDVGETLKKCIAKVAEQPADPMSYLADFLTKCGDNIKEHHKHLKDKQERFELSQLIDKPKINQKVNKPLMEMKPLKFTKSHNYKMQRT